MIVFSAERSLAKILASIPRSRAVVAFAALAIVACAGHESSTVGETAASVVGPDAQANASRGHLQLTGDATVDTDFAVEQCTIGPAGDGPLNGYRMNAKPARGTLQMLSVAVRSYAHDSP